MFHNTCSQNFVPTWRHMEGVQFVPHLCLHFLCTSSLGSSRPYNIKRSTFSSGKHTSLGNLCIPTASNLLSGNKWWLFWHPNQWIPLPHLLPFLWDPSRFPSFSLIFILMMEGLVHTLNGDVQNNILKGLNPDNDDLVSCDLQLVYDTMHIKESKSINSNLQHLLKSSGINLNSKKLDICFHTLIPLLTGVFD